VANDRDHHDELMKRHKARGEENWTPYAERRSDGFLEYTDDGGVVTLRMEVASMGVLVIVAEAQFSKTKQSIRWDADAEVRGRLE
jgi:hypothetical protein